MAKKKSTVDSTEPQPTEEGTPAPASVDYTVLARRYRPQQFGELVGQEPVAQALVNALQTNRVAHAYLFTGARGVGKTSAARILAKALNCIKGPTPTPCDECDNCKAITGGDDTDVIEIDGASNNGVDEVRELRQNVQYRPTRSRYKIYIIDEVHMLTTQAFNALLKTLEEPPPHVKFIFATTEVQKIPITILSRCQRFDFGGISIPRILDRLKGIVASEGMQADAEALELVARRAGGSMRDAQSLLDQLLSFSGERLTTDSVHQLLGTANEERVTALADAVLNRDTKLALQVLNDVLNQGQQLGELLDQLIEYWRDVMVVNCAGLEGQSVSVSSARHETLLKHAKKTSLDTILAGMDILVTAKSRLRFSGHARTLLEMALVRLGHLDHMLSLSQVAQWLTREGAAPATAARAAAVPRESARPSTAPSSKVEPEKKNLTPEKTANNGISCLDFREENKAVIWQQVLENIGIALQAELRKVNSLAISGPNTLVLRVYKRYNSNQGTFLEPTRTAKIEEILQRITKQSCSIRVEWIEEPRGEEPSGAKSAAAVSMGQQRQQRSELLLIPLVKQAVDVLGAQIVRAEDGFGAAAKKAIDKNKDTDEPTEDE